MLAPSHLHKVWNLYKKEYFPRLFTINNIYITPLQNQSKLNKSQNMHYSDTLSPKLSLQSFALQVIANYKDASGKIHLLTWKLCLHAGRAQWEWTRSVLQPCIAVSLSFTTYSIRTYLGWQLQAYQKIFLLNTQKY